MSEASSQPPHTKLIYCNKCKANTHHVLRGTHSSTWADDDGSGFWEEETYSLWTCAGCDEGTMELAWTAVGMLDGDKQVYDYRYSPLRAGDDLDPKVFRQLPKPLRGIYREVIEAYNRRLPILCAAGLRSLIEGICQGKQIQGRNLE